MLTFITDLNDGETDVLEPLRAETLTITTLDGDLIATVEAPDCGWTHNALMAQGREFEGETHRGANAYLGRAWVGSTEV